MSRTPSLLDSIRRTIEERNLFSARSRLHFVSALNSANYGSQTPSGRGSRNIRSPLTYHPVDTRMAKMRNKVIQEIIKTEEVYVSQLRIIRDDFMEDTEIKIGFSRRDFNAIFNNIPILLEVNEKLLEELKQRSSNETDEEKNGNESSGTLKSVAEAFINYTPYLKLYSTYASGYADADTLLQRMLSQNPELRALIKAKEENLNNTLQSYLITPIQRVPRYKLLLQQIIGFIGNGGKNDPNVQSLMDSIRNLDHVALHMSEMIRQHENSCKLIELNGWMGKNYHGNLIQPGRCFIKSGKVLKLPTSILHQSLTSSNQLYLILLSDQIVSCKIKSDLGSKGCLQPSLVLPLKKCSASIVDDLYAEVRCEEESLKFAQTDPEDLIEWVKLINDSSKSLKKRSATLKKPSSNAKPLRREQIKNILKENKKGVKRSSVDSPGPTPGKLRRFLNISGRLDEIAEYLSPSQSIPQTRKRPNKPEASASSRTTILQQPDDIDHIVNLKLIPVSRYPQSTCMIL